MTAILSCASSPCNNDATCVEVAQGYKCNCKPGFTGANCDIEEDECVSSPCTKGSTCVDKVGDQAFDVLLYMSSSLLLSVWMFKNDDKGTHAKVEYLKL